jgi:hypothetical protein
MGSAELQSGENFMTANIWKDGEIVFWSIEVSLIDSSDASSTANGKEPFASPGTTNSMSEDAIAWALMMVNQPTSSSPAFSGGNQRLSISRC